MSSLSARKQPPLPVKLMFAATAKWNDNVIIAGAQMIRVMN